jgi:hypothetical protein
MIRHGNRDTIGRIRGQLGQMGLAVAALALAAPGRGRQRVPAGLPAVGLGAGRALLGPTIRGRGA